MKSRKTHSTLRKRGFALFLANALAFSALPAFSSPALAADAKSEPLLKAGSISVTAGNVTKGGPFPSGTANSDNFRIPALVTTETGALVAAADARYDRISADGSAPDGGGLDTIASVSEDGGKTWNYSLPIYFPDSRQNAFTNATTIIDPALMVGPDNTIYCIADACPTGVTTMGEFRKPGLGTGYAEVDGEWRLALTTEYTTKARIRPDSEQADYEYYVGDFEDGYASVLSMEDGSPSEYVVDEWYNLYSDTGNGTLTELTQTQVDSDTIIQQNVFYAGSALHVYETGYLFMVSSKDNGRTWENPTILNTQIKRPDDENDQALLVSPGKGITTKCGDIVVGCYNWKPGRESASIVYSTDNGASWRRTEDMQTVSGTEIDTSSENEIVELKDGTLRMFFRHGGYIAPVGNLCYVDAKKQPDGSYRLGTAVQTNISIHKGCNLSALSYSKEINGKQAILVSAPSAVRANGQILTLLVNDDEGQTLECIERFSVPGGQGGYGTYVYSCLSELQDGSIGLLWEPSHRAINYSRFAVDEAGVITEYPSEIPVEIKKDEAYTQNPYEGDGDVTVQPDASIASVSIETSAGSNAAALTITGIGEGYTTAVIDGTVYDIHVSEEHPAPLPGCSHSQTTIKNQKAAGCETTGYTGDTICSLCNGVLKTGSASPAGHNWDEGRILTEVTRETDGLKQYTCQTDRSHQKTEILYASAFSLFMDAYENAGPQMAELRNNIGLYENTSSFEDAYSRAEAIAKSKDASRSAMYRLKDELSATAGAIKMKSAAALRTELSKAVQTAQADIASIPAGIPANIRSAFEAAYQKATAKVPDGLSPEEQSRYLYRTLKALQEAQKNFDTAKADAAANALANALAAAKKNLAAALEKAAAVYAGGSLGYTEDSWKPFEAAYLAATNAPQTADATALNGLADALTKAQAALQKAPDVPKADTAVYKNVQYNILDDAKKTAAAVKCTNKKATKITIPAAVKIGGVNYKVVQIQANVFKNASKLTSVTIGKNVAQIGKKAFYNCKKLNNVTFKGTAVKKIGSSAFKKTASKIKVKVPKALKKGSKKTAFKKMLTGSGMNKKLQL